MVLDPAAPTKVLLSVDSYQIVVAKGRYRWRASYPAILLMSRTLSVDTSGQPLPDITALHFLLLTQLPQRSLPTKTWHTHCTRLSLSGAIILFLVWKIIPLLEKPRGIYFLQKKFQEMLYHWLRQIQSDYIHCLLVSSPHTAVRFLNEGLMGNWAFPVLLFHSTFTTKALPWKTTVRIVSLITGFRIFSVAIREDENSSFPEASFEDTKAY